jgi:hypothetical protein
VTIGSEVLVRLPDHQPLTVRRTRLSVSVGAPVVTGAIVRV